jgi:hypothetical protein
MLLIEVSNLPLHLILKLSHERFSQLRGIVQFNRCSVLQRFGLPNFILSLSRISKYFYVEVLIILKVKAAPLSDKGIYIKQFIQLKRTFILAIH